MAADTDSAVDADLVAEIAAQLDDASTAEAAAIAVASAHTSPTASVRQQRPRRLRRQTTVTPGRQTVVVLRARRSHAEAVRSGSLGRADRPRSAAGRAERF